MLEPQQKGPPPTLPELVPPDADPVWARDALLSLAGDYLKQHRTPTERAWFAEVFRAEYLKAHPVRSDVTTQAEVDFIEQRLGALEGARLLDVACGYGRHSLELARRGHELVGLDLSLDMLKRALAAAQEEGLAVKFVHGDMRDLNFDQVFDGVLSFDTSFGFFSDAENIAVLRSLHRALKRGGRLVIDVLNRDYAIQAIPNRNWWEGDGCLVQEDIEYDHAESRLRIKRFLVYADGTQRDYDISLRLYGPHELVRALELVGFEIVDLSGSVHSAGAFFGAFSPRVVVTARRKPG
ncbi:MAG: methyltransferase domain-containing protein [Myxococcales bacterium]|nr:methyltransferase domain-containing protein [Myxococcales bacterium]